MASIRYARPRLITSEDKRYRAYVEHFILQRQNQRAIRPPGQRDIFGQQAEVALRDWLATRLQLANTRILEYEEQRGKYANIKYRELDALVLENRDIAWVFEIKASRTAGSLRRAFRQLRETRDILHLLYPKVYMTILFVDTGIPTAEDVAALMSGPEPPGKPPETLDDMLANLPQVNLAPGLDECSSDSEVVDLLRFTVDDIIALVGADALALNWEEDEQEPQSTPTAERGPLYSTSSEGESDADAGGSLAAALRRAGLSDQ
jgi:hypothetical protein